VNDSAAHSEMVRQRAIRAVVDLARRILSDSVSIMAGCREMTDLAGVLVEQPALDEDFAVFAVFDSETHGFPLEEHRQLWQPAAFAARREEVERWESEAAHDIHRACRSLIVRFA
jgi:hypothetical protein